MEGNLTKGPILKTLTKLAIPIMASSFLGTLYNITDMAWIGLLGSKAVAGVGVGGMFTWLSQGLAAMARMGGQVQVAQCIGRSEKQKAHQFAQAAVQLSAIMGLLYAAVCLIFARQMVGFFQLQDAESYQAAVSYTQIACGLIVFSFLTLTLTGLYTAQGDSRTPFLANLVGLGTNMILDPVLILGPGPFPRLGVVGAAIATVTAQAIVMSIMVLGIFIQKKENFCRNPSGISEGNLQNRNPHSHSGYGVLCDFYGADAHGIRIWCRSCGDTESGRSDRVYFLEYSRWFWRCTECFYCTELWRRRNESCAKRIQGIFVDSRHLGIADHSCLRSVSQTHCGDIFP